MSEEIDYPKEYDNSGRVANADQLLNKFISDAATFREERSGSADLDLTYGPEPRNMMDIFWPDDEAGAENKSPIVLFIHGGYWQRMDRSSFSHLASGLNARGIAVAMPSYTLCPDISIEGIINEMRRACLILYQTYKQRLTVIGHSAGGHLAACMMATQWDGIHPQLPNDLVASGMGISGLYDLLPICKTPVNDAVQMDEDEARAASPILWLADGNQKFEAWVGGAESSEYHRQGRELAERWTMLGTPTQYVSVGDENHFTVVDELTRADSPMVEKIVELVNEPEAEWDYPAINEDEVNALMQDFGLDETVEEDSSNGDEPVKKKRRRKAASPRAKRIRTSKPASKPKQTAKAD